MDDRDSFIVEYQLADSDDVSPSEFQYLFVAIDGLTRSLVIEQVRSFIEGADISDRAREEIFASFFRLARDVPAPAHIISIRRESPWSVSVALPIAAVLWAIKKMIAPEILRAWDESRLRDTFRRFVRDGIFRGAREQMDASAASNPHFGNLVVDDVSGTGKARPGQPALRVTLKRSEVLTVELKDRDLMKEFLARIGIKSE
jgi:hypothetical protein